MEQVYRDIKKEWGSDQDVINKMKNLLITSTDILASKLPSLYVSDDKFSTAPSVIGKSAHIVDSNEASNSANTIIQRSDHLQVKNKPILFNSYVKINITKCFNQTVKGVVMNGSVTYYSIEASVFIKDTTPRVFEQNRRYSEFQALHQLLVKKYAHIFIPSLPKIDDALIENGLASKRKRQLCIWLLIPCSLVHIFIYLLIPIKGYSTLYYTEICKNLMIWQNFYLKVNMKITWRYSTTLFPAQKRISRQNYHPSKHE